MQCNVVLFYTTSQSGCSKLNFSMNGMQDTISLPQNFQTYAPTLFLCVP